MHAQYRLLGKVFQFMMRHRVSGTVIVPWWEKAAWWPLVRVEDGWAPFVVGAERLGATVGFHGTTRKPALLVPAEKQSLAELPVATLWALRIDFSHV